MFILGQNVTRYKDLQSLIGECEKEVGRRMDAVPAKVDLADKPLPPATQREANRSASAPPRWPDPREKQYRLLGVDLTGIPGVNTQTVQDFIGEVGPDLSRFRSASAFNSWMTVCPHNEISGGKKLRAKTRQSNSRAAKAFRMAAQSSLIMIRRQDTSTVACEANSDRPRPSRPRLTNSPASPSTGSPPENSTTSRYLLKPSKNTAHTRRIASNARKLDFELVPIQQSTEIYT